MIEGSPHPTHDPVPPALDEAEHVRKPRLENQMEERGPRRHLGVWKQTVGLEDHWFMVEINETTVTIQCIEESRRGQERRTGYYTDREQGVAIVRAMAKALGVGLEPPA